MSRIAPPPPSKPYRPSLSQLTLAITLAITLALSTPYALADDVAIVSKQDLGTLKADNSGWSRVSVLSADGKVAGGDADNDLGNGRRAVIWSGDSYATKTDLGTLQADNSGGSRVRALSADGKVAGGEASSDLAGYRAVIWSGAGYTTKTDLGTLRADNSGESVVYALSADGTVAGGGAYDDQNGWRATLWRLDYPAKIDVANTTQTINELGADSFSLMAMQSHALDRLQYSCRVARGGVLWHSA